MEIQSGILINEIMSIDKVDLLRFLFLLLPFFCNSCAPKASKFYKVHYIGKEYDSVNKDLGVKTSLYPEFYCWYKDSFIIEEIKTLTFKTVNNITDVRRILSYYTFIDLRKGSFYT